MRRFNLTVSLFLASLFIVVSVPAKASLLLEPYVGYELGKYTYTSSPTVAYDFASPTLGARVGYAFPVIFVAADYNILFSGNLKNGTQGGADGTVAGSQLFADVGASLPLVRVIAGYGLMNTFTQTTNSFDSKAQNGSAYKLGIGTMILPKIALNLAYIHSDFDNVNGNSNNKTRADFYQASISIPLNL